MVLWSRCQACPPSRIDDPQTPPLAGGHSEEDRSQDVQQAQGCGADGRIRARRGCSARSWRRTTSRSSCGPRKARPTARCSGSSSSPTTSRRRTPTSPSRLSRRKWAAVSRFARTSSSSPSRATRRLSCGPSRITSARSRLPTCCCRSTDLVDNAVYVPGGVAAMQTTGWHDLRACPSTSATSSCSTTTRTWWPSAPRTATR